MSTLSSSILEIHYLANSMVDMSRSIEKHENSAKALMESFVELIAQAIDDKSPYTAGHCERVPELGIWLANAASDSTDPLQSLHLKTKMKNVSLDWQRGYMTVVKLPRQNTLSKETPTETIYNRIHEIRTRLKCCCATLK